MGGEATRGSAGRGGGMGRSALSGTGGRSDPHRVRDDPGGSRMRILVTETDAEAAVPAERQLIEAGHEVVRCRADDGPAFPCAGLEPGGCPIEGGIDVALTVRTGPRPHPTAREDGVTCALRRHVPLVVAGPPGPNPFEGWSTVCVGDSDLVAACESAAAADVERLSAVACDEAVKALERRGHAGGGVDAITHRSAHQLKVEIALPDAVTDAEADAIAVAVADRLRSVEPTIAVIDVRRA